MGPLVEYVLWVVVWVAVGTAIGFASIPAGNWLFAKSLPTGIRTALGRIMWVMTALTLGEYCLVKRAHRYDLRRVYDDGGDKYLYMGPDEDDVELVDGGYVVRFGLEQFGVVWMPEGEQYENLLVDEGEAAIADGGERLLNTQPGGHREFVPSAATDEGERLIWLDKAEEPLEKEGQASQVFKAKDVTLKNEGGSGAVGNTMMALASLGALCFGALMGWVVFGL